MNGLETFWMKINTFSDKTPEDFSQSFLGIPPFTNGTILIPPREGTRGVLPLNYYPPPAVDGEQGCGTPVTQQLDGCNSCGVHSGSSSIHMMEIIIMTMTMTMMLMMMIMIMMMTMMLELTLTQ